MDMYYTTDPLINLYIDIYHTLSTIQILLVGRASNET